jgi:Skp family chaperone for outer membrane proteins
MKTKPSIVMVAAALLGGALVLRQTQAQPKAPAAAPASMRIAVCDVVKVFANCERSKDLKTKFAERARANKAEDERRAKQIESIEQELRELKPSSKEFEDRMEEMSRLSINRETWAKFEDTREMRERMRLTEEMYRDVQAAVAQVAKDQGLHVVINSDETPFDAKADIYRQIEARKVLYNDGGADITDAVLARLNEAYKAKPGK